LQKIFDQILSSFCAASVNLVLFFCLLYHIFEMKVIQHITLSTNNFKTIVWTQK